MPAHTTPQVPPHLPHLLTADVHLLAWAELLAGMRCMPQHTYCSSLSTGSVHELSASAVVMAEPWVLTLSAKCCRCGPHTGAVEGDLQADEGEAALPLLRHGIPGVLSGCLSTALPRVVCHHSLPLLCKPLPLPGAYAVWNVAAAQIPASKHYQELHCLGPQGWASTCQAVAN